MEIGKPYFGSEGRPDWSGPWAGNEYVPTDGKSSGLNLTFVRKKGGGGEREL